MDFLEENIEKIDNLKAGVKVVMLIIVIVMICGVFKVLANFDNAETQKCMDHGYTEEYCRSGL